MTSVADRKLTWKGKVTAPAGYSVSVTPTQLTLEPGESASFDVTITNTGSGKIGEWATGDLTWKTGNYAVRSPISVKGVSIGAPAEVAGTGTSGSTTFDVKFGYSGPYTAAAHGLAAPKDTNDQISQDPDQTYTESARKAPVLSKIPVTLTEIAHARWSLKIPGNDDLDLYLLDPSGEVVAQSTSAGTDELIDLSSPPDGDYTLVVHGWAVPSAPLDATRCRTGMCRWQQAARCRSPAPRPRPPSARQPRSLQLVRSDGRCPVPRRRLAQRRRRRHRVDPGRRHGLRPDRR